MKGFVIAMSVNIKMKMLLKLMRVMMIQLRGKCFHPIIWGHQGHQGWRARPPNPVCHKGWYSLDLYCYHAHPLILQLKISIAIWKWNICILQLSKEKNVMLTVPQTKQNYQNFPTETNPLKGLLQEPSLVLSNDQANPGLSTAASLTAWWWTLLLISCAKLCLNISPSVYCGRAPHVGEEVSFNMK